MMKKWIWILLPIIIIGLLVYFIATINVYTGSSSSFFYSAFKEKHSEWECKKFNLRATVPPHDECALVKIEDCNTGEIYILLALGDFKGELYRFPKDATIPAQLQALDEMMGERLCVVSVKHKRWFETVYELDLYGVDKKCWYMPGTSTIRFRRVKD